MTVATTRLLALVTVLITCTSTLADGSGCPGGETEAGNSCKVLFGEFASTSDAATVTPPLGSGAHALAATAMLPFEPRTTEDELQRFYDRAASALANGEAYRDGLVILNSAQWDQGFVSDFDCPTPNDKGEFDFTGACEDFPENCLRIKLLCDPSRNFATEKAPGTETPWVVTDSDDDDQYPDVCRLSASEVAGLEAARDTFAYQVSLGWAPQGSSVEETRLLLLRSIRAIADVYLSVADEFFIDAMEFRVSLSDGRALDSKLADQLRLTTEARLCYGEAVDAFIYGFSPAVGTNIYASDFFGEPDDPRDIDGNLFRLFNLTVERWANAWREEGSKRRALGLLSEWSITQPANDLFRRQLTESATETYLISAALAAKQGEAFLLNGGERLQTSLDFMRNLALASAAGLNPLGYDDRFIPLRDFSPGLLEDARAMQANAEQSYQDFLAYRRELDTDVFQLKDAHLENANSVYKAQLAILTGAPLSMPESKFDSQVRRAGDDFFECSLELDNADFVACMNVPGRATGTLASKYFDMHLARIRWREADQRKQSSIAAIESENQSHANELEIEHWQLRAYRNTLESFLQSMRNARTTQVSEEKFESKVKEEYEGEEERDNDEDDIEREGTTQSQGSRATTTTTYYLSNPVLINEIRKESDLQDVLSQYRIKLNENQHRSNIENLLRQIAEQEVAIDAAIALENASELDFANLIGQRNDLVFQWRGARDKASWDVSKISRRAAEAKVLKTRAGLQFGTDFNQAVRFAYLAAKSLEYKFMRPLVNIPVGGADNLLNISDLFKIQDVVELDRFIDKLDLYDACPWGSIQFAPIELSLVWDILGYNDAYLETQAGRALTDQELEAMRERLWRGYVARNLEQDPETGRSLLRIRFSTSLTDPAIDWAGLYNAKIWWGVAPSPCDPVPTNGVAVNFDSSQPGTRWKPRVIIEQSGSNTFLTPEEEIVEYTPVGLYLNMTGENTDTMFRSRALLSDSRTGLFIGEEPNPAVAWSNGLKGRGIASPNWTLEVKDVGREPIQWHRLHDIVLYVDVIGATQ